MNTLIKMAMKVQRNEQESGRRWGVVTNGGAKQAKTSNYPPKGDMPLKDSVGKPLKSRSVDSLKLHTTGKSRRTMGKEKLKLDAGTGVSIDSGRKMKPGQMTQKPALGGEKKGKSGDPKIKHSTGGMRKMRGGQPVLTNAEGKRV